MPYNSKLEEYYAARAAEYDQIYQKPERQSDLRTLESEIPSAFTDRKVLEVACGTGYWTSFIAPKAKTVVAIDVAEETLEIAQKRKNVESVDFRIGDAFALPETLGIFDAAFAGFWISHVPKSKLRTFVEGLHKKLSKGARVVFIDNLYVEGNSTPISARDAEGNTYQTRRLQDGTEHRVLKNFPSETELMTSLKDLATDAQLRLLTYYWALSYATA